MQPGPPLDWPEPPPSYYLLENPWPIAIVLLILGAALVIIAYRTGGRRVKIAAAVVGALAAALVALAYLVTTDREAIDRNTESLVGAAVVPVELDVFRQTLSKDVRLFDRDYQSILDGIQRGLDRWNVRYAYITGLEVDQTGDQGRSYLAVITRLDSNIGGGSTLTRWMLHWKKEPDGAWRVVKIEWLSIGDEPARASDLP